MPNSNGWWSLWGWLRLHETCIWDSLKKQNLPHYLTVNSLGQWIIHITQNWALDMIIFISSCVRSLIFELLPHGEESYLPWVFLSIPWKLHLPLVSWSSLDISKMFEFLRERLLVNGHCYNKNDIGLDPDEYIETIFWPIISNKNHSGCHSGYFRA